jgi:hypothetical protein
VPWSRAKGLDREIEPLERLDASSEQQHTGPSPSRRARRADNLIARREQALVDALRDDFDALGISAVVAHELVAFAPVAAITKSAQRTTSASTRGRNVISSPNPTDARTPDRASGTW